MFNLGFVLGTPEALEALKAASVSASTYIARHHHGDWGCVCTEDARLNDAALRTGSRLFCTYTLPTGVKIWIIPEADRSATTVLLPSEY